MGHVQDTLVSTSMISNVFMKVHTAMIWTKIFFSKSYEQTDLKTAIVKCPNKTHFYTQFLPFKLIT